MLDVGQGDSIYLSLPNNIDIVIDAGPDDRVLAQLGQYMRFNDRNIELLIISHLHSDHIGGIHSIAKRYHIKEIWYAPVAFESEIIQQTMQVITDQKIPTRFVEAGQVINGEGYTLTALHPPPDIEPPTESGSAHDATTVFKFAVGDFCLMLTGDLDIAHEDQVLAAAEALKIQLSCPILKATHHGSRYGSGETFLAAVQPELVLISVGERNRYRHPAPEALERFLAIGATVLRTDHNGTITIETDGKDYWTKSEK